MNAPPRSPVVPALIGLAIAALAACAIGTFAGIGSADKSINGVTNCGTGRDTDVGCYYQAESIQRAEIAKTENGREAGRMFAQACGFAAVTLAACAVAIGSNRGGRVETTSVTFPKAPGGAAFPPPPQPAAQQPPYLQQPQQPGGPPPHQGQG